MSERERIVSYTTVSGDPDYIGRAVEDLIDDGWQPYGSPVMTTDGPDSAAYFVQAMVLYERVCE